MCGWTEDDGEVYDIAHHWIGPNGKQMDKLNAKLLFDVETSIIELCYRIKWDMNTSSSHSHKSCYTPYSKRRKAIFTLHTQVRIHFIVIHTDCVWNSKLTENVNACTANKKMP